MKELKAILAAYQKVDLTKQRAALATVVKVKGSSYRSPGARMLITDDGRWVGSISGGCLEGDALRKARFVMQENKPMTVTYDTREESNQNLGIGLGCNGVIDVLIEPIDGQQQQTIIDIFTRIIAINEPVALATVFSGPHSIGKKILLETTPPTEQHRLALNFPVPQIVADLQDRFTTGKSEAKVYRKDDDHFEVFLELVQPCISLFIFGGGFDARPVSQLAKSLGWEVTVTDECVAHIAPLFFPTADKLSLCHRDFIDRDFKITPYTACVLMSHNYEYDRDVLRKIIKSDTPYIGILGPRKRYDKMMVEFEKEELVFSLQHREKIHSPIGLDIGAETPDEIALSIIAEIQGKFANRSGGFLKYRNGPIHQRDGKSDQVFKQIYLYEIDNPDRHAAN
jgi:xanthine/CO dehydrogenase XdhC/CoxF family maturation factor